MERPGDEGLWVTSAGLPNPAVIITRSTAIAPDPRAERAALCLAQCGIQVLLVGWDRGSCCPCRENLGAGINIRRVRATGRYGGGMANLWGLVVFNLALINIHLRNRPRVIHAVDLDTAIPALLAKWLIGSRFVYDIADWYSASRRVGCLAPLISWLERLVVRKADYVFLADERRLQQIGREPCRWAAICNSPKTTAPSDDLELSAPYFAYVGVLHRDRGIEDLGKSAVAAGVNLVIGGYGPLEEKCRLMAEKSPLIRFLGKVPYKRALRVEGGSVAVLALYDPNLPNNRLASPNKLYEAMMLGKPIITSAGTLVADIVTRERIGSGSIR